MRVRVDMTIEVDKKAWEEYHGEETTAREIRDQIRGMVWGEISNHGLAEEGLISVLTLRDF